MMPQINILVVDDEKEIADLVEIYLVSDGYLTFYWDKYPGINWIKSLTNVFHCFYGFLAEGILSPDRLRIW